MVLSKLPLTLPGEFEAAVAAAKAAFPAWRDTPVPTRARVMLKFQQLIRENWVRARGGGVGGGWEA
jgi:malonate-semialdehyde dehydrogenase (acetylating)/methylmalonate-semialdehyde dehydrogenase